MPRASSKISTRNTTDFSRKRGRHLTSKYRSYSTLIRLFDLNTPLHTSGLFGCHLAHTAFFLPSQIQFATQTVLQFRGRTTGQQGKSWKIEAQLSGVSIRRIEERNWTEGNQGNEGGKRIRSGEDCFFYFWKLRSNFQFVSKILKKV